MEITVMGNGMLVEGPQELVSTYFSQLETLIPEDTGRFRRMVVNGAAGLGNASAVTSTHREYIEFSPHAKQLLAQHGVIDSSDSGFFRSFVRDANGFAGNLDWKSVDLGPQQALALQSIAVQLAMRAAVKDVLAAIERVEGKIDKLVNAFRSERLGAAFGDQRTLGPLAERIRNQGQISKTDWSTIDSLGAQMARDIESLRAYVHYELGDAKAIPFVRSRSAELKELTNDLLKESLALIVVAEQNYMLWQEIRIAYVGVHEPEALGATLADARQLIDAMAAADQALLDEFHKTVQELLSSTGYEGFSPLERYRLRKRGADFNDLIGWFADQRHLDSVDLSVAYPSLRESSEGARKAVTIGARTASAAISSKAGQIRARRRLSTDGDDDDGALKS